jgi:hypothetical protein
MVLGRARLLAVQLREHKKRGLQPLRVAFFAVQANLKENSQ